MLDLKAQLAAAGIVTAEQVKAFDEKEAKAKEAREAKAQQRKSGPPRGNNQNKGGQNKGGQNKGGQNRGGQGRSNSGQGNGGQSRSNSSQGNGGQAKNRNHQGGKGRGKGGQPRSSVDELKAMGRGEAYDRIRKIVAHSRLDDKERTIPLPDDQTFNFVTSTGRIGRLYLTAATVASLKNGKTAISSFMSNHGLSHCVLPKEIALELAEVFPYWLRHLHGHEPLIEVPEDPTAEEATQEASAAPEAKPAPEASAAPEAKPAPEASAAPEAKPAPEASAPEASAQPE